MSWKYGSRPRETKGELNHVAYLILAGDDSENGVNINVY